MGVEIVNNPIFTPKNDFAFIPAETTIVDKNEKIIDLIVEERLVKDLNLKDISLVSSTSKITCDRKSENWKVSKIKNITRIEIPIEGNGIGEKGSITAKFKDKEADISIEVIPPLGGLFSHIEPSDDKTIKQITWFDKENGIIYLYCNHPLIQKYMEKRNFNDRPDYIVFTTDTIVRCVIKAMIENGVKNNSSKFPIANLENPTSEIENYLNQFYYEKGYKLHDIIVRLAKNINLKVK